MVSSCCRTCERHARTQMQFRTICKCVAHYWIQHIFCGLRENNCFNRFLSHRFAATLSFTDTSKVYKPLVQITDPLLVAPLSYPIYNCHHTTTGHFILRKANTKHVFWHHFEILTNVALSSGQNKQLGTDQAPNAQTQVKNVTAVCGQFILKLVLAFVSLSILVMS